MEKINKRKHYYLILDTETSNSLENPLVYDLGLAIIDKTGKVYHTDSLLIYDIYRGERELMKSAYYAEKLPMYERQYKSGLRRMVAFSTARKIVHALCDEYQVKAIIAHNARFDNNSLNTSQRYLTKSKYRYFLPYGIPLWCTLTMARDVIAPRKTYIDFCNEKPDKRLYKGRPRLTAEILYQYISGDDDFVEEHTGLADVLIEKEIFALCVRQKKKMRRSPWKERELQPIEQGCPFIWGESQGKPLTEMQKRVNSIAKMQTAF